MEVRSIPLLFVLAAAACGKVADPEPPFVRIPEAATDFSVEQVRYDLRFRWTNPSRNLDQSAATGLARALILAGDEVVAELEVTGPGEPQTFDLPVRNLVGATREYAVYFGTLGGRFSEPSPRMGVTVVEVPGAGPAPEAVVDEARIRIRWDPPGENPGLADGYVVYRSGTRISAEPAGGRAFDDLTFIDGESYTYAVVPVRTLGDRFIEGLPYPEVEVVAQDRIPPAVPANLEIVPVPFDGGAFLRWEPSPQSDVSRYRVYRRSSGAAEFVRIDDGEQTTTAFRDAEYAPGLEYAASAVDAAGNESPLSEVVSGP